MSQRDPQELAAQLLAQAGLALEPSPRRLAGGGNNQVYLLGHNGDSCLLKLYFRHPGDPRDRLGAEYGFLDFAWRAGLRRQPKPLARLAGQGAALYQFLPGRRPQAPEIGPALVDQALDFYLELNRHRQLPKALALPLASEACLSLEDHLGCVRRRLARLEGLEARDQLGAQALELVRTGLAPAWRTLEARVLELAAAQGWDPREPLPQAERRLSPSDFGFQNVLLDPEGRAWFLDFEYAGWDDPAKMVCDFFCQPALPAPRELLPGFARRALADSLDPAQALARVGLVWPVHWLKWCCLLLSEFLSLEAGRRGFAEAQADDATARQRRQLTKAREALGRLPEPILEW